MDTSHLLEQLVAAPNRFSVEEKNRIRRNLEGFHPMTVSKAKADSEEFFKIIMGFPNPKPRNIEKDVKVFPWKILEPALKKIIGKYSASPSSTLPPANMMTPVSSAPCAPLPTPPGQSMASHHGLASHHGDAQSQYSVHSSQHDSMLRNSSPQQQAPAPPMRINTALLPAVTTYDTRTVSTGGYGASGLHTPISHHPSTATPPRWDPATASYPDSYPSLPSHHASTGQSVYGATTYGDGAPRA